MAPAASSRAAAHHSVTVSFGPMVVRQRWRRRRWLRWVAVAVSIALLVYLQLCLHARLQAAMDSQPRAPPAPNAVAEVVAEATATAAPQALSAAAVGGGSAGRVPAAGQIPMLVHQSWRDDGFPKDMFNFRWQEAILALNPGWKLMRWTDATSRQLIADDFPWFLSAYDAYPSYIQRCDAARYFIMYSHGGLYADLDYECTKPFGPVLGDARAVFSHKQGVNASRGLVNAIFASEARHYTCCYNYSIFAWEARHPLLCTCCTRHMPHLPHLPHLPHHLPGTPPAVAHRLPTHARPRQRLGHRRRDARRHHPLDRAGAAARGAVSARRRPRRHHGRHCRHAAAWAEARCAGRPSGGDGGARA